MQILKEFVKRDNCIKNGITILATENSIDISTKSVENWPIFKVREVDGVQFFRGVVGCLEKTDSGKESKVINWICNFVGDECEGAVAEGHPLCLLAIVSFLVKQHSHQLTGRFIVVVKVDILDAEHKLLTCDCWLHDDSIKTIEFSEGFLDLTVQVFSVLVSDWVELTLVPHVFGVELNYWFFAWILRTYQHAGSWGEVGQLSQVVKSVWLRIVHSDEMGLWNDYFFKEFVVFHHLSLRNKAGLENIRDDTSVRNSQGTLSPQAANNLNIQTAVGINYAIGQVLGNAIFISGQFHDQFLKLCLVVDKNHT